MQQWSLKVCVSCPLHIQKPFILKTCSPWSPLLCLPDILLCFWSLPHCQAWRATHPLCHSGHWSLRICLCGPVRKYRWVARWFCTISCKEKGSGKQPPKRKVRWQQLDRGPGGLASPCPDRCLSVRSQGRRWQQSQARLTHLLLHMWQGSFGVSFCLEWPSLLPSELHHWPPGPESSAVGRVWDDGLHIGPPRPHSVSPGKHVPPG